MRGCEVRNLTSSLWWTSPDKSPGQSPRGQESWSIISLSSGAASLVERGVQVTVFLYLGAAELPQLLGPVAPPREQGTILTQRVENVPWRDLHRGKAGSEEASSQWEEKTVGICRSVWPKRSQFSGIHFMAKALVKAPRLHTSVRKSQDILRGKH